LHHEPFGGCYSTAEAIGLWPFTSLARCRWRALCGYRMATLSIIRPYGLQG